MNNRVLLGMSGGIDSSVAAIMLQEQGYEVVGITFLFSGSDEINEQLVNEAKSLAGKLHIKHITVDLRNKFSKTVIKYFTEEYRNGRTPFPCAYCNPKVKFKYLEEYAARERCSFISTGHYVKIELYKGKKYIFQGADPEKDQSFFLWGLKGDLLDRLIFPLGKFKKEEIRKFARQKGFTSLSNKKDSLGICFIEGNNYRKFLEKEGIRSEPGNFVDENGNILGQHQGIINYTIGQRRGLGLNINFPVFVAEIRLDDNEIVLKKYDKLYRSKIIIKNFYFIDNQPITNNRTMIVKIRYRLQETPCRVNILNDTRAEVDLLKPEAMIAPGQTAVFYDGSRLVGGGFIESSK